MKAKYYILLRKFGNDLLSEISVDNDPATFLYAAYIDGYVRGLIEAFDIDKSEASNIRTEAAGIKEKAYEKIHQVQEANKYREALDYCKDRLVYTADSSKVLHAATTSEVIQLYETACHNPETCYFYDEYEVLEAKYLKKEVSNESNS